MMSKVTANPGDAAFAAFSGAWSGSSDATQRPCDRRLAGGLGALRPSLRRRDRSGQLVGGRYRILRLLGQGGMGVVWLALDCVLTRPVALKESWRSGTADEGQDSPLRREARFACAVSDPGVVQVYDLIVEEGREWIVMEALGGATLAQTIRQQGPFPVTSVIDIGLRLLQTLRAVHREGFIHGDLKPSNVQLDGKGRPVLTDFGLAFSVHDTAARGAGPVVGSPAYLAPEVIRTGIRSPASDLFALGATLYEAAQGRRRFDDGNAIATALDDAHRSPALNGGPVGQVIEHLLSVDPRHRLSVLEAYAWLKEIKFELTPSASGTPAPPKATVNSLGRIRDDRN